MLLAIALFLYMKPRAKNRRGLADPFTGSCCFQNAYPDALALTLQCLHLPHPRRHTSRNI